MIAKILVGIFAIIVLYIMYIVIKSALQLKRECDELEMVCAYNLLVIYKKYLTGKEDIELFCEVSDGVDDLFNPFNFKTLLTRTARGYIIQYFKDNYYILDAVIEKWPEEMVDIERMRMVMEKWI